MPTPTARDIGRNVQRYRYLKRLSQAEVGAMLGLDRAAVSRIERGERSLTATELAVLAGQFQCDPALLLIPTSDDSIRVETGRSGIAFRGSAAERDDYTQLAWAGDLLQHIGKGATVRRPPTTGIQRLTPVQVGELMARRTRELLELDAEQPVESVSAAALAVGCYAVAARFPTRSRIAGASMRRSDGVAVAIINNNHPIVRQRFSLAHELGHVLIDDVEAGFACDAGEPRPGPKSTSEYRADVFASALLIPHGILRRLGEDGRPLHDVIGLETRYRVSRPALLARLRAAGLVGAADVAALRRFPSGGSPLESAGQPAYRVVGQRLATAALDTRNSAQLADCDIVPDEAVVP